MSSKIVIPKIVPHCDADGCQMPAEHICTKCGKGICEVVGGIIGDEGHRAFTKRFKDGHAVYCMYCRFTAKPHVYCVRCAGDHELMLSFRGSCRTAYRSLSEQSYEWSPEGGIEGRSQENATEMAERRDEKYRKMDSHMPKGAKLIRSQEEQDFELPTEEAKLPDGTIEIRQINPKNTKNS